MPENTPTYIIYAFAIIDILIIISNFELHYRFNNYIRQDQEIAKLKQISPEKENLTELTILFAGIFVVAAPVKLQLFRESEAAFYVQLTQQIIMFIIGIKLNISSIQLLCTSACLKFAKAFYTFQKECIEKGITEINQKTIFQKMPLPPWKTEPTTILIIEPLLDKLYLKEIEEKIFSKRKNLEES